jgi:glycosyltransferase involved in cell wall biosynthesis
MISIITPVYNGEKFIAACIENVIDQNCPNVEHIIMDGGSSDRTVEIIKHYATQYSHIKWISEKDKGQSDAMNKGVLIAKGEILGILNVDDYYEPNVLHLITSIFNHLPEISLLIGNCNVWNTEGKLSYVQKPGHISLEALLYERKAHPVNPSCYFYHTLLHQKIGLYDTDEHYAMDLDFLIRAVQVAKVRYVDQVWGNWRRIEGTKTLSDDISGTMKQRKQLSLFKKILLTIEFLYHKTFGRIINKLQKPTH